MAVSPSLQDLRRRAEDLGVAATDEDLELVLSFLRVLLPAFEELERLVPPEIAPAALFVPVEGP
jgi:hypothetical protein